MGAVQASISAAGSFVRFSALGYTWAIALLGAASARPGLSPAILPGLLGAAAAYHVQGYVLNDVVDLPVDRHEPQRASSPLVRGAIGRSQALVLAVAQVPIAFALTALLGGGRRALWALAISVLLGAAYNLWGKRVRYPIVTDIVQGFAWGALALWAAAVAGEWTVLTGVVLLFVVVLVVMVNGVHGAVRDVVNDVRCGARSTAIMLGVQAGPDGGLVVPRRMQSYAVWLQGALSLIVLAPLLSADLGYGPRERRIAVLAVVLAIAVSGAWLASASRRLGDQRALRSAGKLHLISLFWLPIGLLGPSLRPPLLAALLAVFLAPTAPHRWLPSVLERVVRLASSGVAAVHGSRVPTRPGTSAGPDRPGRRRQLADLLTLTRAKTCLVAGAAALLGGYLTAGMAALRSGSLVCAGAVTALVVATVNVVNDRQDAQVDAFEKRDRPLPSGRLSRQAAGHLAIALVVASTVLGTRLGLRLGVVPAAQLALGLAYCYRLKDTVLVGNIVVAVLFGSTIAFGAVVAGGLSTAAIVASVITALFLLGFEVLKTVADIDGDARAGLRTVATVLGLEASLRIHRATMLVFVTAALLPWPLGLASPSYGLAVLLIVVLPVGAVVALLSRSATAGAIHSSIRILRAVWVPGLLAMVLLR